MEMTQSAFNVLLDMTSLREMVTQEVEEAKRIIRSQAAAFAEASVPSTETSSAQVEVTRPQTPVTSPKVYYYDGQQRAHLSRAELLARIHAHPQHPHIIWVPRSASWVSWREIPNLVRAIDDLGPANTSAAHQRSPHADHDVQDQMNTQRTQVLALHTRAHTHHEASVRSTTTAPKMTSRYWPLAPIASQNIAQAERVYLSIPETDFTRFRLELSESDQLKLYVGSDGEIDSGGLFINTPRALNVGDYIQLTITHHGRDVASFEAPVQWLRLPQGPRDHFGGGVGVEWPSDLSREVIKALEMATADRDYDFYDA